MIRNRFSNTKSKYKNQFEVVDGIKFRSRAEAAYYLELKLRERGGQIKSIELQPSIKMTYASITYRADFQFEEAGRIVWVDVKGTDTPVFNLKLRLYSYYGEHTLRIVRKNRGRFDLVEEITPANER
jgi:hypothetical protein